MVRLENKLQPQTMSDESHILEISAVQVQKLMHFLEQIVDA